MLIALIHLVSPGIIEIFYYSQAFVTEAKQSYGNTKNYYHFHYHSTWEPSLTTGTYHRQIQKTEQERSFQNAASSISSVRDSPRKIKSARNVRDKFCLRSVSYSYWHHSPGASNFECNTKLIIC